MATETKVKKATAEFYDLKAKAKVTAAVTEKSTDGKRFWFKGQTKDGRTLTTIVSKDKWEAAK